MKIDICFIILAVCIIVIITASVLFSSKQQESFYNKEKHQIYYDNCQNKVIKKMFYLMGGVRESHVEKCVGPGLHHTYMYIITEDDYHYIIDENISAQGKIYVIPFLEQIQDEFYFNLHTSKVGYIHFKLGKELRMQNKITIDQFCKTWCEKTHGKYNIINHNCQTMLNECLQELKIEKLNLISPIKGFFDIFDITNWGYKYIQQQNSQIP